MLTHSAICERCKRYAATNFHFFPRLKGGRWLFACDCKDGQSTYPVSIEDYFKSPASAADWQKHLSTKCWMDEGDFFRMIARFVEHH